MSTAAFTRVLAVFAALLCAVTVIVGVPQKAQALSGSDFDPEYIISDAKFYDANALSESQIQAFLDANVGACLNGNCLKVARTNTTSRAGDAMCGPYAGAPSELTSTIIFKVQRACGISAAVLLVTLQKEQGLITNNGPSVKTLDRAMGYACPDSTATPGWCDPTYGGLYNQIYRAAWQFKRYGNPPGTSNFFTWFPVGRPSAVQYHPVATCGAPVITIRNAATAALYYYTPYQPNPAALVDLNGTGNACSAYGNRNFWVYYNNWFGSPTGNTSPIGNIELIQPSPGNFRVVGWALDPSTADSIDVHVYVGPVGVAVRADKARQDVASAYNLGANHGFDAQIPAQGPGNTQVCVYGINQGPGANVLLGCVSTSPMSGSPVGVLDTPTINNGKVNVSGWALDPDVVDPITVHLYVDSAGTPYPANVDRHDSVAKYPAYGSKHGFSQLLQVPPGTHQVCAYGINVAAGGNVQLGCSSVAVPDPQGSITEQGRSPIGRVESVTAAPNSISVTGWALDPDSASSINVHVYIDSAGKAITANASRSDVGAAYPGYGTAHGFTYTASASPGTHQVCIYGIDTGPSAPSLLGCSTVTVPGTPASIPELGRAPVGSLEAVTASSTGITAVGWALDPDTASPIEVHVYVDAAGHPFAADLQRSDVAAVYPAYGAGHGFNATVAVAPGAHNVCAYGINNDAGGPALLGCKVVTVPGQSSSIPDLGRAPIGNFEALTAGVRSVVVAGWALDPDSASSIKVHIYVDGIGTPYAADKQRPDIASAYPAYGTAHGFAETVPAVPGGHSVCAYGIDSNGGPPALLGCKNVTVSQ